MKTKDRGGRSGGLSLLMFSSGPEYTCHHSRLTDSVNLLQNAESETGCPDWHTAIHSVRL